MRGLAVAVLPKNAGVGSAGEADLLRHAETFASPTPAAPSASSGGRGIPNPASVGGGRRGISSTTYSSGREAD